MTRLRTCKVRSHSRTLPDRPKLSENETSTKLKNEVALMRLEPALDEALRENLAAIRREDPAMWERIAGGGDGGRPGTHGSGVRT